jgi:hypothetical protein
MAPSLQSQMLKLMNLYPSYASLRPHINDDGTIHKCCGAALGTMDSVVTTMTEITEVMNWSGKCRLTPSSFLSSFVRERKDTQSHSLALCSIPASLICWLLL